MFRVAPGSQKLRYESATATHRIRGALDLPLKFHERMRQRAEAPRVH